jgi:hypothetical protein
MRANAAIEMLTGVAIPAQHLEAFRIIVFPQPGIETSTADASDLTTMFSAIIIDVIDGEENRLFLFTTSTTIAVCR